VLLADMAHVSGLVVGNVVPSPFDFADVVKEVNKQGQEVMYDY